MKQSFQSFVIKGVSVVSTFFTALQLTQDFVSSIIFCMVALVAFILALVFWDKNQENAVTAVICAVLVWGCTGYNHWNEKTQKKRYALWNEYIASQEGYDEVKALADLGDGPALQEMAQRYWDEKDYDRCRDYAQRAALKGIPTAYSTLSDLDLNGYGCAVNYSNVVKNTIAMSKLVYVDIESMLEILEETGYVLSESERRSLDRTEVRARFFMLIQFDALQEAEKSKDFWQTYCSLLRKHRDEILEASDDGYLVATQILYQIDKNAGTDSASVARVSHLLYDAGIVPTSEKERIDFMRYLGKDVSVSEDRYKELEKERLFPLSYWDNGRVERFTTASNASLLSTYDYLRLLYSYYKRLDTNVQARTDFHPDDAASYGLSRAHAGEILEDCISEILRRVNDIESRAMIPES